MDTSLLGRAKELQVAGLLVAEGVYVYYPLVDVGFDLVASNRTGTVFIPVQVKFKHSRTGFSLHRDDAEKFVQSDAVLAFGSMNSDGDASDFWFVPAAVWGQHAIDEGRRDQKVVAYFSDGKEWSDAYKGREGLRLAFKNLLN